MGTPLFLRHSTLKDCDAKSVKASTQHDVLRKQSRAASSSAYRQPTWAKNIPIVEVDPFSLSADRAKLASYSRKLPITQPAGRGLYASDSPSPRAEDRAERRQVTVMFCDLHLENSQGRASATSRPFGARRKPTRASTRCGSTGRLNGAVGAHGP
jgi:hypothetical protein